MTYPVITPENHGGELQGLHDDDAQAHGCATDAEDSDGCCNRVVSMRDGRTGAG